MAHDPATGIFHTVLISDDTISVNTGPPDAPYNCSIANITDTAFELSCLEGWDGGSAVTFALQFKSDDGTYQTVHKSQNSTLSVNSIAPNTKVYLKLCAYNEEFKDVLLCSAELNVTTTGMKLQDYAADRNY